MNNIYIIKKSYSTNNKIDRVFRIYTRWTSLQERTVKEQIVYCQNYVLNKYNIEIPPSLIYHENYSDDIGKELCNKDFKIHTSSESSKSSNINNNTTTIKSIASTIIAFPPSVESMGKKKKLNKNIVVTKYTDIKNRPMFNNLMEDIGIAKSTEFDNPGAVDREVVEYILVDSLRTLGDSYEDFNRIKEILKSGLARFIIVELAIAGVNWEEWDDKCLETALFYINREKVISPYYKNNSRTLDKKYEFSWLYNILPQDIPYLRDIKYRYPWAKPTLLSKPINLEIVLDPDNKRLDDNVLPEVKYSDNLKSKHFKLLQPSSCICNKKIFEIVPWARYIFREDSKFLSLLNKNSRYCPIHSFPNSPYHFHNNPDVPSRIPPAYPSNYSPESPIDNKTNNKYKTYHSPSKSGSKSYTYNKNYSKFGNHFYKNNSNNGKGYK